MNYSLSICLIALLSLISGVSRAQISTVSDFNYYDINKSEFTVDASCFGLSVSETEEYEYRFTSIQLANELASVFNNSADSLDQVVGGFRLMKRPYLNQPLGGEDFRYILLRPNDTIIRPVILLTTGGQTGGASPLRMLSLGIYDYVQRGFAVAFYQSGTATGNNVDALADAGFTAPCQYDWSPDETMDCFQQAVYVKYQFGVAARDYTTKNSDNLFIDESLMFATGFSGGSLGTLYLALTDIGDFTDSIFAGMGNFNNLSRYPTENGQLKAAATLAGAIIDPSSSDYKVGNTVDASDQSTRFLMLHGQDDFAVQPETTPLQWSDPNLELPGSQMTATMTLDELFKAYGIDSKAIINCSACHNLYTWPCDYNDDCFGNNPLFDLTCILWAAPGNFNSIDFTNLCSGSNDQTNWNEIFYVLDQVHDYAKIISKFFHEDFADSGSPRVPDAFIDDVFTNDEVYAVNPTDFPFNEGSGATNGHYAQSSKCLAQTCSALYFNQNGDANLLGINYQGDYLTMSTLPSSIFNSDFTLELHLKAIGQDGLATVFSLLDNLTLGIEIGITGNGFVQFRKTTLGGQGAITGDIDILDGDCHIISLTREGNEFGLYVDGVLQEIKKTFPITVPNVNPRIGNTHNELLIDRGFNGVIRNMVVWSEALTEVELGQTSIPVNETNLVAEWQFNDGVGQAVSSTNGSYPIDLGINQNNASFDPRWMRDDELCSCSTDPNVGLESAPTIEQRFVLYPNPNKGEFWIDFAEQEALPNSVAFYSIEGALIRQTEVHGYSIKFNEINRGIYVVHFVYNDQIITHKVIIQ